MAKRTAHPQKTISLAGYLEILRDLPATESQKAWDNKFKAKVKEGWELFHSISPEKRTLLEKRVQDRVRTEELKAWYSEPEEGSLFQGTSVTSLTIPFVTKTPLKITCIGDLEEQAAEAYIKLHDRHKKTVSDAILENVDGWIKEGLFYGLALSSKVVSQAFGLSVPAKDVIFEVEGRLVDPHEITSYPSEVRKAYFKRCMAKVPCFGDLPIQQREFETSLVLADISKPKIKQYDGRILLAPPRCNEIAAMLSRRIANRIREKTKNKINIRSLAIVIYDTDTPYTYHRIMRFGQDIPSPVLPGLTVLGSSGSIDAFRWLYTYRVSLLAQKIQKGSLYSQAHSKFMPFVFFGVLVPRDADILLGMDDLGLRRYMGNLSSDLEYLYSIPSLLDELQYEDRPGGYDEFMKNAF